jgi:hypothetical protein
MPIWSRYRYRVEDYWPLIQVLRQSNKYTHGLLVALSSEQAQAPERRQPRGMQQGASGHPLSAASTGSVLERHQVQPVQESALASERPERNRPSFRFQPDATAPNLLAHRHQGPPQIKGARVIPVPEGWVILGRKAKYRGLPLLSDLRVSPSLRLVPVIIRWRPEFSDQKLGRAQATPGREDRTLAEGRLSLQINRDFVKLKLKLVHQMTSKKHFYRTTPDGIWAAWKKEAELIKGVNQITRELIALKRWAYIESDTYSAYDSEVRSRVKLWLTSVRHRKAADAQRIVWQYVLPWRYNPDKLPSKLTLQYRAAQVAGEQSSQNK